MLIRKAGIRVNNHGGVRSLGKTNNRGDCSSAFLTRYVSESSSPMLLESPMARTQQNLDGLRARLNVVMGDQKQSFTGSTISQST